MYSSECCQSVMVSDDFSAGYTGSHSSSFFSGQRERESQPACARCGRKGAVMFETDGHRHFHASTFECLEPTYPKKITMSTRVSSDTLFVYSLADGQPGDYLPIPCFLWFPRTPSPSSFPHLSPVARSFPSRPRFSRSTREKAGSTTSR